MQAASSDLQKATAFISGPAVASRRSRLPSCPANPDTATGPKDCTRSPLLFIFSRRRAAGTRPRGILSRGRPRPRPTPAAQKEASEHAQKLQHRVGASENGGGETVKEEVEEEEEGEEAWPVRCELAKGK